MKTKLTNAEQVRLIKDDLRRDLENTRKQLAEEEAGTRPGLVGYAHWCRDLIARTDWTAEQFIYNRIPPTP